MIEYISQKIAVTDFDKNRWIFTLPISVSKYDDTHKFHGDYTGLIRGINQFDVENVEIVPVADWCCESFRDMVDTLSKELESNYYVPNVLKLFLFSARENRMYFSVKDKEIKIYCPFCGERIKIIPKVIGELELHKKEKVVCSTEYTPKGDV